MSNGLISDVSELKNDLDIAYQFWSLPAGEKTMACTYE